MELKKSKQADLRNKQGLFLQVGMLVALVIAAFQWSISERNTTSLTGVPMSCDEFIHSYYSYT